MTLAISPVVMRARIRNHILMCQRTRRLQELNQLKNGMLSMVAHDLRNPLSAIQGYAGLARRDNLDPEKRDEFIGIIEQGAKQLLRMVGDLLDYSQIEHGGVELNPKPGDLARLVRGRCQLFAGNERAAVVQLLVGGEGEAPLVFDEDRIIQVVDNLIGNALKFSPSNTMVSVNVAHEGDGVLLTVEDQGPGLPAEDLERIFQPFTRSRARPQGSEKGVGLGLSIVRNIVQAHGGTIRVESEEGRGAKFLVWLPGAEGDG
jgi:signal transduction histidine kinase